MPQIDVPFLPGDKVRVRGGGSTIWTVTHLEVRDTATLVWAASGSNEIAFSPDWCEAVNPVIEWRYVHANVWESADKWWRVSDAGTLVFCGMVVGRFPDPRAVAEETQALWNERAVSKEGEGK